MVIDSEAGRILSHATSLRAPSFGGVRTLVAGLNTWTSHDADARVTIYTTVSRDTIWNKHLGWASTICLAASVCLSIHLFVSTLLKNKSCRFFRIFEWENTAE